jgi:hypothetical protein
MVTYWVNHSQVKECFPSGPSLIHVKSMRWTRVILLGMGFLDIQELILSHLWVPLQRVCFPLSAMHDFSKPFCHLIY